MTKILLDTDVVINILKKKEETLAKIDSLGECEFYISNLCRSKTKRDSSNRTTF